LIEAFGIYFLFRCCGWWKRNWKGSITL